MNIETERLYVSLQVYFVMYCIKVCTKCVLLANNLF